MALNGAILTADSTVSLVPGEKVFCTTKGVKMLLETGGYVEVLRLNVRGYPGLGGVHYSPKGTVVLTNFRIVYIVIPPMVDLKNVEFPLSYLQRATAKPPSILSYGEFNATVLPVCSNCQFYSLGPWWWSSICWYC
jgi:hypothetical protein